MKQLKYTDLMIQFNFKAFITFFLPKVTLSIILFERITTQQVSHAFLKH
jgi:hypothetical protein